MTELYIHLLLLKIFVVVGFAQFLEYKHGSVLYKGTLKWSSLDLYSLNCRVYTSYLIELHKHFLHVH